MTEQDPDMLNLDYIKASNYIDSIIKWEMKNTSKRIEGHLPTWYMVQELQKKINVMSQIVEMKYILGE